MKTALITQFGPKASSLRKSDTIPSPSPTATPSFEHTLVSQNNIDEHTQLYHIGRMRCCGAAPFGWLPSWRSLVSAFATERTR
eukprot:4578232-Amphidinium_carterae.2